MNTIWIIAIVVAVLAIKGILLHRFIQRKMAESEANHNDKPATQTGSSRSNNE